MPEPQTSCPYGADSDIEARYLAGTLAPDASEAFEEHYFSCDRCFMAVQRGTEILAALSPPGSATAPAREANVMTTRLARRRVPAWQPALAAAAVVVAAIGIWRAGRPAIRSQGDTAAAAIDASRGRDQPLTLTSHATETILLVTWSPPATARSYRVRLFAADGSLLFERETADTTMMISREVVRRARDEHAVYWEVQALDALRSVVATSPAVQAQTSPAPR